MNIVSPRLGQHWYRRTPQVIQVMRGLAVAALLSVVSFVAAPADHVRAAPSTPLCPLAANVTCGGTFEYGHSWYVNNPGALTTWAYWSGSVESTFCGQNGSGTFLDVLDFGRPGAKYATGVPLDRYAVTTFGGGNSANWHTYREVEVMAEDYADTWFNDTSSCPRLVLALGTNNSYECQGGVGDCSVYTAGQQWDVVVHDVANYLAARGESWQISVWGASDLETEWDPWTTTVAFLNGYTNKEGSYSSHPLFIDYGDANYGVCSDVTGSCSAPWSQQNVYDAAWGIGWNVPIPETYTQWLEQRWLNVNNSSSVNYYANHMQYYGLMAECTEADTPLEQAGAGPLPSGNCYQQGNLQCEWSPNVGFNALASDPNQIRLTSAGPTNIWRVSDGWSGNNGC